MSLVNAIKLVRNFTGTWTAMFPGGLVEGKEGTSAADAATQLLNTCFERQRRILDQAMITQGDWDDFVRLRSVVGTAPGISEIYRERWRSDR